MNLWQISTRLLVYVVMFQKNIFSIYMHAYIHTHISSPLHTHKHTSTRPHPHPHTHLHTYTDTHNIPNLQGVSWVDMSLTGKNVLNITQENVVVFRRRARKLSTEGDVRRASWGLRAACLTNLFYDTLFLEVHISLNFMYFSH